MLHLYKVSAITLGVVSLTITSLFVCAQTITTKEAKKFKTTIGFRNSGQALYTTQVGHKLPKVNYSLTNSILFREPLTPHMRAEAMINFSILQNPCCIDKIFGLKPRGNTKGSNISIPLTLQYYPRKQSKKLHPFFGAGLQYNKSFMSVPVSDYGDGTTKRDAYGQGTKYISILFTQGITYEVNTKIEISQRLHFIPDANKTLGIDIGIGYNIR